MRRRVRLSLLFFGLFFVSCFSIVSFARENTIYKDYGGITLTCYIKCTSSYGEGSTSGVAMDGYKNYIHVATYDINQKYITEGTQYMNVKASVHLSKGSPYLTRTYHAITDTNDILLLPVSQRIQQAQGR